MSAIDSDTQAILSRANVGLEEAYHEAPLGVIVLDRDGRIVLFNPEAVRIFGYSPNEVMRESLEILIPSAMQKQHVQYRQDFLRHPQSRRMGSGRKIEGRHKDGTLLELDVAISYINTSLGVIPIAYFKIKSELVYGESVEV